MARSRIGKRRAAAIQGAKVLITSASVATVLAGWMVVSRSGAVAIPTAEAQAQVQAEAQPRLTRPADDDDDDDDDDMTFFERDEDEHAAPHAAQPPAVTLRPIQPNQQPAARTRSSQ